MIIPTIGRVVYYYPAPNEFSPSEYDPPHAAIIVRVWNSGLINLICFDHNGNSYSRQNITLSQSDNTVSLSSGYASWMPYQLVQAGIVPLALIELPPHPDLQPRTAEVPSEQAIAQSLESVVGPVEETVPEVPIMAEESTANVEETAPIVQDNGNANQP